MFYFIYLFYYNIESDREKYKYNLITLWSVFFHYSAKPSILDSFFSVSKTLNLNSGM